MSSSPAVVSLHPYFKVHPGRLDDFKAALPAFIAKTRTEETCLYYEFTANGDEFFCREAYRGADGVLRHLNNVGSLLDELLQIADLKRLEIHGPETELDTLKSNLKGLKADWFVTVCSLVR